MPFTVSTTPQQLRIDCTGCVTSLVMIGKSVRPSCQKQRERLEYYCTSDIYRGITLLSASTVDSIMSSMYFFYRAAPLASEEDTEAASTLNCIMVCADISNNISQLYLIKLPN